MTPCAACPANTVDIVFVFWGRREVKHVRNIGNVEAARGNIRPDEKLQVAIAEAFECLGAIGLREVAMNGGRVEAVDA